MAAGDTGICAVCNRLIAELPSGRWEHAELLCDVPADYEAPPEPDSDDLVSSD